MKGFFISFEGIDGCGKTTQIKILLDKLNSFNRKTVLIREPGGTDISEKIRSILLDQGNEELCYHAETLLFLSSRAQLVDQKIIPALDNGEIVVSDRYSDSTEAYQGIGRNIGQQVIRELNNFATQNIYPNITFIIDIDYEEVIKRKVFNSDRMELNDKNFFIKISNYYKKLSSNNASRYYVIDGADSIENIHKEIWRITCNALDI